MSRSAMNGPRPSAPDPLPIPVPDNHTHLDMVAGWDPDAGWRGVEPTDPAVTSELDAAMEVGVDRVVQVGTDVDSSEWAVRLAEADRRVLAAVALHPNDAPELSDLDSALARIDRLAASPRVAAIGETGMDFFRTEEPGRARQEESFIAHIEIAKRHGKALMIHDREAHDAVLRVLDSVKAPDTVVMHCFSGDADFAAECLRRGFHLSFAGNVTFKNATQLAEAARGCPPESLLVETDAPFMAPVPHRGRRNGPYLVPVTMRFLAQHLDRDLESLCATVADNSTRVYGDW